MKRLALIGLVALAGCSDAYVQQRPPLAEFQSQLSPDEAVACLVAELNNWKDFNFRFAAQVVAPGKDYYITPTDGPPYIYSVAVEGGAGGSTFRLYNAAFATHSMHKTVKDMLGRCTTRAATVPG